MGCQNKRNFPGKPAGLSNAEQDNRGFWGSGLRFSTIIDVTPLRNTDLGRRSSRDRRRLRFPRDLRQHYMLGKFLEILGEGARTVWWDLTWRKDGLEAGERCA